MKNLTDKFLTNSSETGRHIVKSIRTGKTYFIEVIGDSRPADWGSYNPSTGEVENKKGSGKFTGSISEKDSMITENNGFINIELLENQSPYWRIEQIDSKYPDLV